MPSDLHDAYTELHEGRTAPTAQPHRETTEHAAPVETTAAPIDHAAPTERMPSDSPTQGMPTGAPGQSWPAPAPSLAELEANAAPVRNATAGDVVHSGDVEHTATALEAVEPSVDTVEPVEPRRRGPGRPKGPPVARRLHLALDAPAWASLLMIVETLRLHGRQGSLSEAIRFSIDATARLMEPSTALLHADDMTARTARLLRNAAMGSR